ncbi:Hint domain-containing protein [Ruegeria arenilitoris]|uniref:Hint domain-containing protein n=1 Tax=Ruegeria arenilitoris TaxID=1173585 RepID=UPI00147D08AC|nr:Hint domain-containing protein [Ruegeria arenilitoris]
MPDINGTNNDDDIEVTDNTGSLNGTTVPGPIDNIRARQGDDDVTVTNSTISGSVRGNRGDDDIVITGSTVVGQVNAGIDDDTVNLQGSTVGDVRLGQGNDTLNINSTNVTGDVRGGGGTDSLNLPVGTVVTDDTFGTFTVAEGVSYSVSSGTFILPSNLPSGPSVSYQAFENGTGVPCFTRDTEILTRSGPVLVQDLCTGDMIETLGKGLQQIRWIGRRRFDLDGLKRNPKLYPIRILAGALGGGFPSRDLLVSRQHRMLVQSPIAQRMFDEREVLIPAIKLTALPGIFVDEDVTSVEYYHLLFDQHQIIFAEGAPTESLFTGPEALKTLSSEARREIFEIFPELIEKKLTLRPARYIPRGRQQSHLLERHRKNKKPLLQACIQPPGDA